MDLSHLKNTLAAYFQNKNVFLHVSGAIEFYRNIDNAQIVLDKKLLYLTDGNDNNFQLDMNFFDSYSFEDNFLIIELSNSIVVSFDFL